VIRCGLDDRCFTNGTLTALFIENSISLEIIRYLFTVYSLLIFVAYLPLIHHLSIVDNLFTLIQGAKKGF